MSKNGSGITLEITEKDKQILEALIETNSYEEASKYLEKKNGIRKSANSLRQFTFQMRSTHRQVSDFMKKYSSYRARLGSKKYLSNRD